MRVRMFGGNAPATARSAVSLLALLSAVSGLRAQEATAVPDVTVVAPAPQSSPTSGEQKPASGNPGAAPAAAAAGPTAPPAPEGSEAAGYKPATVSNLGPLGQTPLLDTPYSVNVIPAALIENIQAYKLDEIYKIDPSLQAFTTNGRGDSPNFIIRGFSNANTSGKAEDGMRMQASSFPLEDKERVEVFTGLTSFLYGPTNVGGLVNYVYKRPTETPLYSVTGGDYAGAGYLHADLGGPIDKEGRFAYRLNIVGQQGATAVEHQDVKRDLLTAALSWRLAPNATLTLIGSHNDNDEYGTDAFWSFPPNTNGSQKILYPAAPNASKLWSQPWTSYELQRDRVGTDLNWKINDIFTLRTSYAFSEQVTRDNIFANNTVSSLNGTYQQVITRNPDIHYYVHTGYSFIDAEFDTFSIHHKVTTGFYGDNYRQAFSATTYNTYTLNNTNFVYPLYTGSAAFIPVGYGPPKTSTYNYEENLILGDEVKFNKYWSALVGANYTQLHSSNFTLSTGGLSSAYYDSHVSPSLSLLLKSVDWFTTYATYSESLQPGQVVPANGPPTYTNGGQTLQPYVGHEYEIGAKANVGRMLLTAAFFDIDQALQYALYNPNGTYTYVQNGTKRVQGIELTGVGTIYEGLRVFGGLTLLNPRVEEGKTSSTALQINGLTTQEVAKILGKITLEYDLPFLKGLTLVGGYYYTGAQAIDILNTFYIPSYATEDLGLRYRTSELMGQKLPIGQELVLRANVTNITNKSYWLNTNYVGQPRTFALSAQVKF